MIETQRLKELYVNILDLPARIWRKETVLYFMECLIKESESQDESQEKSGD